MADDQAQLLSMTEMCEAWHHFRKARRERLQFAVRHLHMYGWLTRAVIMKHGEITAQSASDDVRRIRKQFPDLLRYDVRRKRYVLHKPLWNGQQDGAERSTGGSVSAAQPRDGQLIYSGQTRLPSPGPHMGAAYNALYESGTKDDCLIAYARARGQCIAQAEEIRTLRAQLDKLRSDIGWEKDISRWER